MSSIKMKRTLLEMSQQLIPYMDDVQLNTLALCLNSILEDMEIKSNEKENK